MDTRSAGRPRRQALRLPPSRERILSAAEEIFSKLGFTAARLEDVAQAVGLRRSSIVHYFASKQELYDAVESGLFAALEAETCARLEKATTPWDRVLAVIDSWLDYMVHRPTAARIVHRVAADISARANNPVEFSEPTLAALDAAVEEGIRSGRFRDVRAAHVMNILGGGILQFVCNARQLGNTRVYRPDDPAEVEAFREMLHRAARALLVRDEADAAHAK